MRKRKIAKEYCIYVGGLPTELDKFLHYETAYSKRKAIRRAKQLRSFFNTLIVVEEWKFTFEKPCSLNNGFTKGRVISFPVSEFKEAA